MYIQKLKDEIKQLEKKLKQANEDVEAQKFTPHSTAGRKLMAKCRSLQVIFFINGREKVKKEKKKGKEKWQLEERI